MTVTGIPYCSNVKAGYCDTRKPKIDSACHELGKEAGKWIMYDVDDQTCYCICSCLGAGTQVALGDGGTTPVQNLVQGQTQIKAAGLDLKFKSYVAGQVSHAAPGTTKNALYLRFTAGGQQRHMVVTMDHPVLTWQNGKLKLRAASTLSPNDMLVDEMGNPVSINGLDWGSYEGAFWELATTMEPPDSNYTGHLVVTEGIVTGDFAISTFVDLPMGLGKFQNPDPERPTVGSRAWLEKYGITPSEEPIEVNGSTFLPAAGHRVKIPAHASSFLPTGQAAVLEETAPKVGIENQYYLEECEWLIGKVFQPLYPDVIFLFDWYSDGVNSHSWVEDDQQYVYLSGGLARIQGFEYEGVALALAHELGHLYGQPEIAPGITCEGEADFYGAGIVLRKIWFGIYYLEFTKLAIDQMELLYSYLDPATAEAGAAESQTDKFGQPYPSNTCRLETFRAAMQGPDKPHCADCLPQAEAAA